MKILHKIPSSYVERTVVLSGPLEWLGKQFRANLSLILATTLLLVTIYRPMLLAGISIHSLVTAVFALIFGLITCQAAFFLYWIVYAWNDPEEAHQHNSPKEFTNSRYTFTALLPVRHEEMVIADTIGAIANIDYPEEKKELLVLIRPDDTKTIEAARAAIEQLNRTNIRMVIVDDTPVNKPNQLNWGLKQATGDVVVVFDAEDQPHKDIYNIANTVMVEQNADVVQSGVQLMNYKSSWFSVFNCLEYYFWFKSALLFFSKLGVTPLGGNTVFFKKRLLEWAGGWNEYCLTEDGEVGIRLSQLGAKVAVVYDAEHATREETPPNLISFIKQRTRWNLGFLQIFNQGKWKDYGKWYQRLLAGYVLILPIILAMMFLLTPLFTTVGLVYKLPMVVALLSFLPLGFLILQIVVLVAGLWRFCDDYKLGRPWRHSLVLIVGFLPYLAVLSVGAVRAMVRLATNNVGWEKTMHINAHRQA